MELENDHPPLIARHFETVQQRSKNETFRVFQWNVLADALAESSPTHNFCAVPLKYLEWNYRKQLILRQILEADADIVCLQEVDHFDDFLCPELSKHGYIGLFLSKLDSPCLKFPNNNGPDGIAIFYRTARYDVKKHFDKYLVEEDGKPGQAGLLCLVLEEKRSRKSFILCTVHLKAKPGFEHRRLAQTKCVLNTLLSLKLECGDLPIIWCGDFNGEQNEPFYNEIKTSELLLDSAYLALDNDVSFTTFKIRPHGETKKTIDYVWHTQEAIVCRLLRVMDEALVPPTRFPSFNHASDHIPLVVDFCLL